MSKQCPSCGYQPNFWKNKPWGYYCPECAADLKPGKALFKPWKRRPYLVSAVCRIGMAISWFMWARLMLYALNHHSPDLSQLNRSDAVQYANQMIGDAHLWYRGILVSMLLFTLFLLLQTLAAFPFSIALSRLNIYRSILSRPARSRVRILVALPLVALLLFLLATQIFPGLEDAVGIFVIRLSANPFFLIACLLLIVWESSKSLKASRQPLHPLRWNPTESRFEELNPDPSPPEPDYDLS